MARPKSTADGLGHKPTQLCPGEYIYRGVKVERIERASKIILNATSVVRWKLVTAKFSTKDYATAKECFAVIDQMIDCPPLPPEYKQEIMGEFVSDLLTRAE